MFTFFVSEVGYEYFFFHCKYLNGQVNVITDKHRPLQYRRISSHCAIQIYAAINNKITLAFETKKQDPSIR